MIPRILHYCWFGKKAMPASFEKYIADWQIRMPDFQIMCWNEANAPLHLPYLQKALDAGHWANVSNLVRLWAVYHYGGIYLDTDVEIIRSLDPFCDQSCFFGKEKDRERIYVNNAIFGAEKGHWFIKECLISLQLQFDGLEAANLSSPILTTALLEQYELIRDDQPSRIKDIILYPSVVFHPFSWFEKERGRIDEKHTFAIHHYAKTWAEDRPHHQKSGWQRWAAWVPASLKNRLKYGRLYETLQQEKKVMHGPFAGLKFAQLKAHGSSIFPKLIGSYESCLHTVWYALLLPTYDQIIHFGAGEGYYAMGLQNLLHPREGSIAYECDERNIILLQANLRENQLTGKVECIHAKVTDQIAGSLVSGKRNLIVCDVEGDEAQIFHTGNIGHFKHCDLVIELHEFLHRQLAAALTNLFGASHNIEIVSQETMPAIAVKFLGKDMRAGRLLSLMDEGRPEKMRWMVLTSKLAKD